MATVHIGLVATAEGRARTVAIKRLHAHHAKNREFVSMLLDEARIASFVVHPNVVRTLDLVTMGGEVLVVMEHVLGPTLADLLRVSRERRQAIPVAVTAAIAVDVLEGLQAAHEATDDAGCPLGVVHRDVSPQNVIVGVDGRARILDFGVAKAAGRLTDTQNDGIKGKPAYMAPEQLDGRATPATDVHAAAILLWEMLTSRRLHQAETDLETFANILRARSEPPSRYRGAEVSAALDRVTLRGLAPEPRERFSSAREMAAALRDATGVAPLEAVAAWVHASGVANVQSVAEKIAALESRSGVRLRLQLTGDGGSSPRIHSAAPIARDPVRVRGESRRSLVLVSAILLTLAITSTVIHLACAPARSGSPGSVAPERDGLDTQTESRP
jgi:serine/threonine-protein kinase